MICISNFEISIFFSLKRQLLFVSQKRNKRLTCILPAIVGRLPWTFIPIWSSLRYNPTAVFAKIFIPIFYVYIKPIAGALPSKATIVLRLLKPVRFKTKLIGLFITEMLLSKIIFFGFAVKGQVQIPI